MNKAWVVAGVLAIIVLAIIGGVLWSQLNDSRTHLAAKNGEITSLQADKNSCQASLKDVTSDLAVAKVQLAAAGSSSHELDKAKAQVTELTNKLYLANLPEVRVQLSWGTVFGESGYTATVTNISNDSVSLTIEAKRPSSGASKSFDVVLDSGASKQIGDIEGWAFVSGDEVTVNQPSHKPLTWLKS